MKSIERILFADILVVSGCTDKDTPEVDDTLTPLPIKSVQTPPYPNDDCLREIVPGDTLSGIGQDIGLGYTYLIAENGITNDRHIVAGAILDICFNQIDDETGQRRQDPYSDD